MALIRTPQGVKVLKDWGPERIGCDVPSRKTPIGEGMLWVQRVLLRGHRRMAQKPEPVPVPVLDSLEKLVDFLRGH